MKIALVLKKSREYDIDYVDSIVDGVRWFHPNAEIVCLSDCEYIPGVEKISLKYGLRGWFNKLELFRPDVKGDFLYLDLDTIVTGPLGALFSIGKSAMLSDLYRPKLAQSGVMYLRESDRSVVWQRMGGAAGLRDMSRKYRGDGELLHDIWPECARIQNELPSAIASYKIDSVSDYGIPVGASLVCFHGKPRPRDVGWDLPGFARWGRHDKFAIVASGSSLSGVDLRFDDSVKVMAVNGGIDHYSRADYWFTLDPSQVNKDRAGRLPSSCAGFVACPESLFDFSSKVTRLERMAGAGHGRLRTRQGAGRHFGQIYTGNSGTGAIQLAMQMGARKIALFGFDGHGQYALGGAPRDLSPMQSLCDGLKPDMEKRRVDVVNGSDMSIIQTWPRMIAHKAMDWINE